jgi:toxin ParE1/3/4
MNPLVTFRPRARRDVFEQIIHLVEQAGPLVGGRYLDAVRMTCERLATQPLSGRLLPTKIVRLKEIRRFPVRRPFQKYLIFYQPGVAGIDVVRILPGARDIERILSSEEVDE